MKKLLKKVRKAFKDEIKFAQKAGFEGVLVSLEGYIYLEVIYDIETLEEIVIQNGWQGDSVLLNFVDNSQKMLRITQAA
ncbi:MAG: hypothetical protein K0U47_12290 [Epsilonproteobacteria bacterium]|nr:hypothetical protein [Campylobacterota bacterium]